MKEHFCPAEKSIITYQDKCNWCGEKEWVGLTQKERDDVWYSVRFTGPDELAKAIEAKLKEKNA
jgi:hypothetical protein